MYTSEHFVFENIPKLGDCKAIRKGLIKMTYIWLGVKTFLETCEKHAWSNKYWGKLTEWKINKDKKNDYKKWYNTENNGTKHDGKRKASGNIKDMCNVMLSQVEQESDGWHSCKYHINEKINY